MIRRLIVLFMLPLFVCSCLAAGEGSAYFILPDTDSWNLVGQSSVVEDPPQLVGIETYSLEPITPADTSGLKAVLLSVLGDYESIVTEYRYENYNGSYGYIREVQPDYVFLCSAAVFALLLWCVFRMAGGLLCRK